LWSYSGNQLDCTCNQKATLPRGAWFFFVLSAAVALVRMADTARTVSEEKTIRTTQLAELYKLREALGQTGIAARNAYIYERHEDALRELDVLDQQRNIYLDSLKRLAPVLAGQPDFDKAGAGLQAMAKELSRPRQYRTAGQMKEYGVFLVTECSPLRRRIVADLDVVSGRIEARLNGAGDKVDLVLAQSKTVIIAIIIVALLIGAALA
jgi:methyl-accepting chemotaxis protein